MGEGDAEERPAVAAIDSAAVTVARHGHRKGIGGRTATLGVSPASSPDATTLAFVGPAAGRSVRVVFICGLATREIAPVLRSAGALWGRRGLLAAVANAPARPVLLCTDQVEGLPRPQP
ncbi:MAG: hypothetical protein Kow0097_02280 [Candidatus Bipolaricaulota bacterium]